MIEVESAGSLCSEKRKDTLAQLSGGEFRLFDELDVLHAGLRQGASSAGRAHLS